MCLVQASAIQHTVDKLDGLIFGQQWNHHKIQIIRTLRDHFTRNLYRCHIYNVSKLIQVFFSSSFE